MCTVRRILVGKLELNRSERGMSTCIIYYIINYCIISTCVITQCMICSHHDFFLAVLLQEGEQEKEALLARAHDIPLSALSKQQIPEAEARRDKGWGQRHRQRVGSKATRYQVCFKRAEYEGQV